MFNIPCDVILFFPSSTALSAILVCCGGDIPPDKFKVSFFSLFVLAYQCHYPLEIDKYVQDCTQLDEFEFQ